MPQRAAAQAFPIWTGSRTNGGIPVGSSGGLSTGSQTINLNVTFADIGARAAFVLTRGSGIFTFGGTVRATGNVTTVGIGGSHVASIISFNNTISGNNPIVIGTSSLNGGVAGMTNTRVIFAGDSTYTRARRPWPTGS